MLLMCSFPHTTRRLARFHSKCGAGGRNWLRHEGGTEIYLAFLMASNYGDEYLLCGHFHKGARTSSKKKFGAIERGYDRRSKSRSNDSGPRPTRKRDKRGPRAYNSCLLKRPSVRGSSSGIPPSTSYTNVEAHLP